LLSVTEGDDKPAKYPVMFRAADLMLISKTDLLPYLDDFSPEKPEQNLRNLANDAPVIAFSSKDGHGLDAWIAWLQAEIEQYQALLLKKQTQRPKVQQDGQLLHAQPGNTRFYPVSNKASHT
ncbi:MAG: GTP-binding protein, partial [Methylococcales bacterium]|nr:GTP-binding protein [Methylococcales bacterium]